MYILSDFGNHIFSWTTLGIQNKFTCFTDADLPKTQNDEL